MTPRFASVARGGPSRRDDCPVYAAGSIDLYFYGELAPSDRDGIDQHLAACATCREALQELAEIGAALAARPAVSAPPAGDWSAFMSRLEDSIARDGEAAASVPAPAPARTLHRYAPYLAMAALLALVTISVVFSARVRREGPAPAAAPPVAAITPSPAPDDRDTASLVALSGQHFERSKLVVLGLAAKDAQHTTAAEWEYERSLASSLLDDTRLYRMAAEEQGMTAVAGVMRDLELVLLQASLSDRADAATLAQIQRAIRKRDLLEKMTVVTTRGL
jgi:hypothetical protein